MTDELLSIIDSFVDKALKLGADEVEFFAQKEYLKTVNFEANNLKSAIAGIIEGVGIRVLKNKSLGFTSINSLAKKKIKEGIKEAIAIAKVTPPEDYYYLPSKQKLPKMRELYDAAVESFSMDDTITNGKNLLNSAQNFDPRITVDSGTFNVAIVENAIATSNGIEASEKKSGFSWIIVGMAVDGSDIGSFDVAYDTVVKVKEIDVQSTAEDFARKVLRNLGAKKTKSFEGPAVLSPEATASLFYLLIRSANATNIQSGSSFLQDKLGDKIGVKSLTIIDNGTLENSFASSAFDREGIAHREFSIIDSGTFTGVLYDSFTAHKEKLQSTGHAVGSFRNIPRISTTNLEIKPGSKSFDEIISETDHGVLIQRVSTSPDPISGDFSASVKGGRLIKNGEIVSTLKEITAVGNIFTGLNNISRISKEQKPLRDEEESWLVPFIRIEGLKFVS